MRLAVFAPEGGGVPPVRVSKLIENWLPPTVPAHWPLKKSPLGKHHTVVDDALPLYDLPSKVPVTVKVTALDFDFVFVFCFFPGVARNTPVCTPLVETTAPSGAAAKAIAATINRTPKPTARLILPPVPSPAAATLTRGAVRDYE